MPRHHNINGNIVPFTAEEEAARDAEEAQAVIDAQTAKDAEDAKKARIESAKTKLQDLAQSTSFHNLHNGVGNENDECASGYLHLFNPSSTTFVKHFISRFQVNHKSDISYDMYSAGYFNTTSAIDEIQFKMSSGNIDAGDICLYGIA